MTIKYSKITSPHIKSVISQTQWDEKHKIDALIKLEHFIRNGVKNWTSSILFHALKTTYSDDFLILLKEYSLEEFNIYVQATDNEKHISNDNKIEKIKKDWLKAGGKL